MNKNEADEIVEKGLSRLNLKAENDAKRRAKTLNVPYMDKDELNKLVDRGLLRLSRKSARAPPTNARVTIGTNSANEM